MEWMMYIDGKWTKGESEKTFETLNPADGSHLADIYESSAKDSNSVLTAPSTFQTSPERFWIASVRKPICRLLSSAARVVGPAMLTR